MRNEDGNENINFRMNVLKEFEKELNPKTISGFSYIDIRYNNQVIAKRRNSCLQLVMDKNLK